MWKLILFLALEDPSIPADLDPPQMRIERGGMSESQCRAQLDWWMTHLNTSPAEAPSRLWLPYMGTCESEAPLVS